MRDVSEADVVDVLGQSAFMMMGALTRLAAEHDLSLTQLRVLAILRDRRASMSGLAQYLGLDKSTLSGLIARAEKRGLLLRTPSADDRRSVDVSLSPAGVALAERLAEALTASLHPAVGVLDPAERRQLRTLMGKVLG